VIALGEREARRNAWFAWLGAGVALTGVQLIAPSLPVMQEAFGLTESQLALVMSVYLLPAALAAIPIGVLADRVGRRIVFGSALLLFGACGLVLAFTTSYSMFLAVRFVQGLAFAGLLPITMTILGDAYSGNRLVGALGGRSVAISIGDTIPPVIGGFLASLDWFLPWLGQAVAIPLGVAVLLYLHETSSAPAPRTRPVSRTRALVDLFRRRPILALQYAGFLRMFMKFCILTFFPVFLVDVRSLSPVFAGFAVSLTSLAGTVLAAMSGRLARRGRPTAWLRMGMVGMGASLIAVVTLPWSGAILAAAAVYGAADGIMGVFTNSLVAAATGTEQRASFVSLTGAIRNLGKFVAPVAFAALLAFGSLSLSFTLVGVIALASVLMVGLLRPLEEALMADSVATATGAVE
jgi:ACDE family multidrug resistance protein